MGSNAGWRGDEETLITKVAYDPERYTWQSGRQGHHHQKPGTVSSLSRL